MAPAIRRAFTKVVSIAVAVYLLTTDISCIQKTYSEVQDTVADSIQLV